MQWLRFLDLASQVVFASFLGQFQILLLQVHRLLGEPMRRDDNRVVLNEREEPELFPTVVSFDFPNMFGHFFEKFLGHDGVRIFFKEPHSDRDGLRPIIIKLVEPYANRLGTVGCPLKLDGAKFVARFQIESYLIC